MRRNFGIFSFRIAYHCSPRLWENKKWSTWYPHFVYFDPWYIYTYTYINTLITTGVRSSTSPQLVFANCVWYFDRAHLRFLFLCPHAGCTFCILKYEEKYILDCRLQRACVYRSIIYRGFTRNRGTTTTVGHLHTYPVLYFHKYTIQMYDIHFYAARKVRYQLSNQSNAHFAD